MDEKTTQLMEEISRIENDFAGFNETVRRVSEEQKITWWWWMIEQWKDSFGQKEGGRPSLLHGTINGQTTLCGRPMPDFNEAITGAGSVTRCSQCERTISKLSTKKGGVAAMKIDMITQLEKELRQEHDKFVALRAKYQMLVIHNNDMKERYKKLFDAINNHDCEWLSDWLEICTEKINDSDDKLIVSDEPNQTTGRE